MRILPYVLLALGVIGILISLPLLGFAALGSLGILADVGDAENHRIGMQFLVLGLPPMLAGLVFGVLGVLALARNRRSTDAEPVSQPPSHVNTNE